MEQFTNPVAHFQDVLKTIEDKTTGFKVSGKYFGIANIYGEIDLISCTNGCTMQGGFYALTEPREKQQGYVILLYQCNWIANQKLEVNI